MSQDLTIHVATIKSQPQPQQLQQQQPQLQLQQQQPQGPTSQVMTDEQQHIDCCSKVTKGCGKCCTTVANVVVDDCVKCEANCDNCCEGWSNCCGWWCAGESLDRTNMTPSRKSGLSCLFCIFGGYCCFACME